MTLEFREICRQNINLLFNGRCPLVHPGRQSERSPVFPVLYVILLGFLRIANANSSLFKSRSNSVTMINFNGTSSRTITRDLKRKNGRYKQQSRSLFASLRNKTGEVHKPGKENEPNKLTQWSIFSFFVYLHFSCRFRKVVKLSAKYDRTKKDF